MESENRVCQNCQNNFTIESNDFGFYEKMKVPIPTFCSDCRHQRRLAIRNERVFYYRNCDSCKKKIISYYHPDKKQVVWCPSCWWLCRASSPAWHLHYFLRSAQETCALFDDIWKSTYTGQSFFPNIAIFEVIR